MCDSMGSDCCCCPPAKVFQEKICGNFSNLTTADVTQIVWSGPTGDIFEGTFEIFNSANSGVAVTGTITANPTVPAFMVPPGFSISRTALRPTAFTILAPPGTSGTFCITLYKRALA